MSNYTHETVPTQFIEVKGARYAYRRFGKTGNVPLLFLQYFNANMDAWDPLVTNSLAADHEVIGTQYQHATIFLEHLRLFLSEEDASIPTQEHGESKLYRMSV